MLNTFTSNFKQTAANLLSFLKNPTDSPETDMPTKGKVRELFNLLIIKVLVALVFTGLIWGIEKIGWYKNDVHKVEEMLRSYPIWGSLLFIVVLIPLVEEFVFRFGLKFRRGYFTFLLFVLLLTLGIFAFKMMPILWGLGITVALTVLMVLYLMKAYQIGEFLKRTWTRVYGILFYSVAILFGFIHIFNFTDFDFTSVAILLIPILIGSQIWGGLSMGYMRVKYGFFWGFFLHAAHNAVFMVPFLLFINQLEEKLNIRNENYSLKVEEHFRYDKSAGSSSVIDTDTAAFVNLELNDVIKQLVQASEVSIVDNSESRLKIAVNLYYKSKTADVATTQAAILTELQKLYKFDVTKAEVEREMWDVAIEDNTSLAAHAVAMDSNAATVIRRAKELTIKNANLHELLTILQSDFNVVMANKTTDTNKYNFTFTKKGVAELRSELKEKYGLALKSKMIMTQQALVEFR
ncbi:hypothetical protein WG947_12535 [Pontibacter sp. H259]|uniref:hypothetical protein n=1 Tax=Pontibacter sp. H259 TaxID=3133421 RepID=UPI0030C0E57B